MRFNTLIFNTHMKTTLKPLILSILLISFCFAANAQSLTVADSLRIAVGAEGLIGTGSFSTAYKGGTGISLRVDVPLNKKIYISASAGFNNFFASGAADSSAQAIKNVPVPAFETVPLKLGVKWFIAKKLYLQGEAGETFLANKTALYATNNYAFTWSPQFGLVMPLKKRRTYIDTGLRYEQVSSFYHDGSSSSFWALHVAYAFNL
jgi:hypothetical protein